MKKSLTILLILLTSISFSQNNTDSIYNQLKSSTEPKEIIDSYNDLSWALIFMNPDSAKNCAEEAFSLSENINYKYGKVKALRCLSVFSLLTSNWEKGIEQANLGLEIASTTKSEDGIRYEEGKLLNIIATIHRNQSQYATALEYHKKSLNIWNTLQDSVEILGLLNNIGLTYYGLKNYSKALEIYFDIVKIEEKNENFVGIARTYNAIADIYRQTKNIKSAKKYYLKAIDLCIKIDHIYFLSANYNDLAIIYKEEGDNEKSIEYINKAIKLNIIMGNKTWLSRNYKNLVSIYIDTKDFDKAINILNKDKALFGTDSDPALISGNYLQFSNLFIAKKEYKNALEYAKKGLLIASENKLSEQQMRFTSNLYEIHKKLHNTDKSLNYLETYVNIKAQNDSLKQLDLVKELEAIYETNKKEKENEILSTQNEFQKETIQKQQLINILAIVGLLLVIIIAVLIFIARKKTQKANKTLAEQKEEITQQAENLKLANEKLEELDELKQGMTGMLVHDLKNPISTILSLSQNNEISSASKQMLNMVSNILDVQKYEETEMVLDTKAYSLYTISTQSVAEIRLLAKQKNIEIINNITTNTFINTDEEILNRIFINLLTNAIKYTQENGIIAISCKKDTEQSGFVKIDITDNGIGIEKDKLDAVFNKFSQVMAKKSGHARSTGLGLTFCKMATEAHGGKIQVRSIPNKETIFSFTLPVSKDIQVSEDAAVVINKKEKLQLNKKEKEYLSQFLEEYRKYEIFDILPVREITEKIDESFSENIKIWKEKMQKIVYNTNETEYNNLIL